MVKLPALPQLPVVDVLDQVVTELDKVPNLVLVAPPGAGKTTLVPLVLLDCKWRRGRKIIVLEPRRLAARAAANRMADLMGEAVGQTVGYRVRFDSKVGPETQIEVVTEGVFSRMLAEDPGLEKVAAVLFDEFHERSLDGDLALALCLDLQGALREDLRLLPMSATLESDAIANLLNASVVTSQGRSYPVDIVYRERPVKTPVESALADVVIDELARADTGNILAFLPGQREIERTARLLENRLPKHVTLHLLYGALSQNLQDAAIRPAPKGENKVVLSSAIAETSLTIDGITTVVDSGLSRQTVFEPATGLTRLQTVRASQASVIQRAGRAGRLGPGRTVRLWRAEQTAALPARNIPEILNADLSSLLLSLADWGVNDPNQLIWLDAPPHPALQEARKSLQELGAFGPDGGLTAHGKAMSKLPLPPRYAHMVMVAAGFSDETAQHAAQLALLIQERGVGGMSVDLEERLSKLDQSRDNRSRRLGKLAQSMAQRARALQSKVTNAYSQELDRQPSPGVIAAFGLQDRIAQRRGQGPNGMIRFRLANGRGAELDAAHTLSKQEYLVVVDMIGRAGAARIMSAVALDKVELAQYFSSKIQSVVETKFDPASGILSTKRASRLGALTLDKPQPVRIDPAELQQALMDAVGTHGLQILPWRSSDLELRQRLQLLHHHLGGDWPGMSDAALMDQLENWLFPFLAHVAALKDLADGSLSNGLLLLAGHPATAELNRLVPTQFAAPSGSKLKLSYLENNVVLSVRPQELFGLDRHPTIFGGEVAVEVELVSPAGRPIQITRDLPGFWRGSWRDVRADLRGRYPKHPWPENPLLATPTARAKPRKS